MTITQLIAWHQSRADRADNDHINAMRQSRDRRSTTATRVAWMSDATAAQNSVIFHHNAVKLLESINHEQTV